MANHNKTKPMPNKNAVGSEIDVAALFADGTVIAAAVARGVSAALWRHKVAGVPAYIWEDGKVVQIPPELLPTERPLNVEQALDS